MSAATVANHVRPRTGDQVSSVSGLTIACGPDTATSRARPGTEATRGIAACNSEPIA